MNEGLTLDGLAVPLRVLRLLAVDFPHLTAPNVDVSPLYPEVLRLSLHESSCDSFAAFESWRRALGIECAAVDFHTQSDGRTAVLKGSGVYGGADIELTAFASLPADDTAFAGAGGAQ
ncbi:hypothetical protein GT045_25340 [Streptomyces sp. SID486]|uniref:hypothetical protein n=1 Tax=Streptomyces sp. SID486 TaxID=2690264 RepID=UPI00136DC9D0|nr:hypothetical protein [Streptomyces sp. SID486]MYX98045.1 hypothetical protein [Streptomyces sp. SID486]